MSNELVIWLAVFLVGIVLINFMPTEDNSETHETVRLRIMLITIIAIVMILPTKLYYNQRDRLIQIEAKQDSLKLKIDSLLKSKTIRP